MAFLKQSHNAYKKSGVQVALMPAKQNTTKPLIVGVSVIAAVLVIAIVMFIPKQQATLIDTAPHTPNELLFSEVLGADFVSSNITVLGVSLGMTEDDVLQRLGTADIAQEFEFGGIKNWQYAEKLGLNQSGVIFHIEQRVVTRIIVTAAMDEYLSEANKVSKTKAELYAARGIPDRQYDLKKMRFFVYNTQGYESYLNQDKQFQYSFVYPNRKMPSLAVIKTNITNNEILQEPALPVLLTDTTTLCDQGATFGQDPETKECTAFVSSCTIPDYWQEVSDCTAARKVVER